MRARTPSEPRPARAALPGTAFALALAVGGGLAAGPVRAQPPLEYAREDPTKIVTAEACGECHLAEHEVWKKTAHATGFKTLHRKEAAEAIAGRMGFRLIKRDSLCLRCHYTPTVDDDQLRAVSGVSCESCHGAGRGWINVHNDYGAGADVRSEADEHRRRRVARARELGMRRPSDLYPVAATCFDCHLVSEEKLVNVGGHSIGSAGFELVVWSQGEIRHNFLAAQRGGSKENAERSPAARRRLYVVGRALELEYALRGLAAASETGVYAKAMIRRVRNAVYELQEIAVRAALPEVEAMVAGVRRVTVTVGERQKLLAAAAAVGEQAQRFLGAHDGTRLASLDPLVEGTAEAAFSPEDTVAAAPAAAASGAASTGAQAPTGAVSGSAAQAPTGAASASTPTGAVSATPSYASKTRLRPRSRHATVDVLACGGCHRHREQNAWWSRDPHEGAAVPFHERDAKNVQIARLYGLKPEETIRGDRLCMDCHGTVVTGQERREVWDGVSCQSCHGPAKDYLEPHQEGDKALGGQRPGYLKALELGMRELRSPEVLAANCASCHYVTDPGLLSTGHPSGADFDLAARLKKIKHWVGSDLPVAAGALAQAWRAAAGARGPVPEVAVASLPADADGGGPAGSVATTATGGEGGGSAGLAGGGSPRRARPVRPPPPRPADPQWIPDLAAVGRLELPPFPEIDPAAPVEERLLLLKERLELLYRSVGGEGR